MFSAGLTQMSETWKPAEAVLTAALRVSPTLAQLLS